ncbi:hypothetical protein BDR05DRAFT_1006274 [Suillus weaverae]|nr:hypothetical protein BDR05DRAFT_1006274 [Suillus weaverae]
MEQGKVQLLLKDIFTISQDADFIVHQPAIHEDVYSYKYEDGPGPDTKNLAFDLTHGSSMPWNARILNILLEQLQRRNVEEQWLMRRSDGYYKVILEDHYKQLQTTWRAAQPKVMAKGILETAAEVEERLITKRDENLKLDARLPELYNAGYLQLGEILLSPSPAMSVIPDNQHKHTKLGNTMPHPNYTSSATSENFVLTVLNVELEYLPHF